MATLSRIVLGSELARTMTALEKTANKNGAPLRLRLYQLGDDKFRLVVTLEGFDESDWTFAAGLPEPTPDNV